MTVTASSVSDRLSMAFNNDRLLETECKQIASDIKEKSISLVTVVEALGPFITSNQIDMTKNSVHALTNIFSHLPKHFLNTNETRMLLTFYIERLKDHYSILNSTLTGILHLLQMNNIPADLVEKLLHEMFTHVSCQTLQRSERNAIFLILKYIIYNKSDEASKMNDEFVNGVMNCIDGERDPRNLLLLFEMIPDFLSKFSPGDKTEDMFEIIACYFPVDYNPVEGEGGNITRDILANKLSPCLYAIPQFAEYCLPLMIEKIDSNLKIAKMDSLKVLRDCTFKLDAFQPMINEMWVSLKEAAMSSDPEVKSMTMEVITKIVQVISTDSSVRDTIIERVINDTKWTLSNVQLSSFWSSENILEAVAKANRESCQQVLKFVIPLCLGQYSTKTSVEEKAILLKTMKNFVTIAAEFDIDVKNVPELSWTDIPMLLIKELDSTNDDIKVEALNCFLGQKRFINSVHRNSLYQRLCDYVEAANETLRKSSLLLLEDFAKMYPKEVSSVIVERLPIDSDSKEEVLKHRLEVLSVLAKESEIGYSVLPKIIQIAVSNSSALNGVALDCLNNLCSKGADFDIHRYLYENGCMKHLIARYPEATNEKRKLISSMCRSILRKLNIKEQQQIFNEYLDKLQNDLTDENVLLFELVVVPMHEQVVRSVDVKTYFYKLTTVAMNSKNACARLASAKLVAVLIHKLAETDFLETYIKPARKNLVDILKNDDPVELKHAAVVLHTWLTKSLVVGGFSSLATECITDQIDFLRHHEVGEIVAKEFKTLMDKNEDTITKENGCKFMFLYKQRIFEDLLIENVFDGAERRNFLIALTTALEEVPVELLCIHIQTIVPILAESLTLTESQLLLPILKTLNSLLTKRHEILISESKAIIPVLLDLISHKEMKIRILAVECLNNYCGYPSMAVYSFKPDVLDKLQVVIDDHKRLVRKIAVTCRSRWFLYEQP